MRTVPKWVNKIHEADKVEFSSVHSICFSPDGSQLVVGAGEKVMVYDPRDGALVQLLQAHKGAVHAVAYCGDGKKFASGSADKNVIIWTAKMEGILKYSHSEPIQCLAYNPVTYHLASCALSDFAFWSMDVKAVQKFRVSGRITSCAWSTNGKFLAIGLAVGAVSIRDKMGDESYRVTREAAVWAVAFAKSVLVVTDWNDTLSFYNVQGQQIHKERNIGISALCVTMLGALVLVGGVGGWAVLTSEGVPILSTPQEWVWAIAPSPSYNNLAVACQDGTLWCYQTVFSTVHGLYRERYAYRENMTDVIIQHLTKGNKVRIKCHDRVQKIAIYKHRLAVQLPERVVVYEQGDVEGMLYRVKEKLPQTTECSLLVATSDALLLCQDTKLSVIGRQLPKSWTVPAPIRYVKVTTLYFEEVLLLGLMNGQIWQVEPRHGKAAMVLLTPASVRCLDVSASRAYLAVVDEASVCRVYNLSTKELLFSEENISSVSWNSWCDELLSLSGGGVLSIKACHYPPATQPLAGSVVGFQVHYGRGDYGQFRHFGHGLDSCDRLLMTQGGRVFCLQANSMQTINVPLSHAVHQYIQNKMFKAPKCLVRCKVWVRAANEAARNHKENERGPKNPPGSDELWMMFNAYEKKEEKDEAYSVACLGVTALDWERLGVAALEELAFEVARKAFQRSENIVFLTLIDQLQERFDAGENHALILGEVFAYRGRYAEAARSFRSVGRDEKALNLYVDLRMFNKAQEYVGEGEGLAALARRRAEWARHVNEPRAAAEMYLAAGDVKRAAELMADTGRRDMLIELARKLDKGSSESLRHVAVALVKVGEPATAADVYQRLGDYIKVAQLAVAAGEWSRAFALAREHNECKREVYLPYAHRMAQENKFVEAQKAYHMAGETATAMRVFTILVGNAVVEERFSDAGYLHHLLAIQFLETAAGASTDKERDRSLRDYSHHDRLARIYHAYDVVHGCVHEPFSLSQPEALLNAARYILALLDAEPPPGVSMFCLYLCLAKQAKALNTNTLARQMLDKILGLQIPHKFQESLELLILKTRAAGGDGESHEDDVAPLCWRCRRHAPPLSASRCPFCRHKPAHSLATHEVLPLVQFEPAEGITYEEALDLIDRAPMPESSNSENTDGAEILRIDHDVDGPDPFLDKVDEDDELGVVVCSRASLLQLCPASVIVVKRPPLRPLLYRNMLPELPAVACQHCQNLFYMEDLEVQLVTKGHCPFCRHPAEEPRSEDDENEDSFLNDPSLSPTSPSNERGAW